MVCIFFFIETTTASVAYSIKSNWICNTVNKKLINLKRFVIFCFLDPIMYVLIEIILESIPDLFLIKFTFKSRIMSHFGLSVALCLSYYYSGINSQLCLHLFGLSEEKSICI